MYIVSIFEVRQMRPTGWQTGSAMCHGYMVKKLFIVPMRGEMVEGRCRHLSRADSHWWRTLCRKMSKPGDLVLDALPGTLSAVAAGLLLDIQRRFMQCEKDKDCVKCPWGLIEIYVCQMLRVSMIWKVGSNYWKLYGCTQLAWKTEC